MAPRETENNAYAKFWGDKQRTLWYVMVFLKWSIGLFCLSKKEIFKPVLVFLCRALCSVANVMALACGDCLDNCRYMVYTNKLGSVVDLLAYQMKVRS